MINNSSDKTPAVGQPLDAESVRLLVRGDLVRNHDWDVVRPVDDIDPEGRWIEINLDGKPSSFPPSHFTFLGRPEADGWIKHEAFNEPPPDDLIVEYITGSGLTSARMKVIELRWDRDFKWRPAPLAPSPTQDEPLGVDLGELKADLTVLSTCDDMEVSHNDGDTNVGDVARRSLKLVAEIERRERR